MRVGVTISILGLLLMFAMSVKYLRQVHHVARQVESAGGFVRITSVCPLPKSIDATYLPGARLTSLYMGHYSRIHEALRTFPVEYEVVFNPAPLVISHQLASDCAALSGIRHLFLERSNADDRCVQEFARSCPLEVVGLSHTKCREDAIIALCKCRRIRILRCDGLEIGDRVVENLRELSMLEYLDISETQMTLHGVRRLCDIASLRTLRVYGLPLETEDLDRLRLQFPNITLVSDENWIP